MSKPVFTISEVQTFIECRLKHYLKYIECLTPKRESLKLQIGRASHKFMETLYLTESKAAAIESYDSFVREKIEELKKIEIEPEQDDLIKLAATKVVCEAYADTQFPKDLEKYVVLFTERQWHIDTEEFIAAGVVDIVLRRRKQSTFIPIIMDHKFLRSFDPNVNMLMIDLQLSMYAMWAMHEYKVDSIEVLYNAIKKPQLRFNPNKETAQEFLERVKEIVLKDPDAYFGGLRASVIRNKYDVQRFLTDFINSTNQMLFNINNADKAIVYRNPQMTCEWKCPFFNNICVDPSEEIKNSMFIKRDKKHAEIEIEE